MQLLPWDTYRPADTAKAVTLTANAYTTVYDDLVNLLDVTTGAVDATINLLSAEAAGDDAIQPIRKIDSGVGRVIIKSGSTIIGLLVAQGDTFYARAKSNAWLPIATRAASGLLAKSGVQLAVGAFTIETVIATIPIPAGLIGPKGVVEVDIVWSMTNNANAKTGRVRLGGLAGSSVGFLTLTSFASARSLHKFWNRDAENSQVYFGGAAGVGQSGTALGSAAVDTAVAQDLVITGTKANAGDVLAVEAFEARLIK